MNNLHMYTFVWSDRQSRGMIQVIHNNRKDAERLAQIACKGHILTLDTVAPIYTGFFEKTTLEVNEF